MAWGHSSVFLALSKAGYEPHRTKNNSYIQLYPQRINCAILYAPGGTFDARPLHFHPGRGGEDGWRPEFFLALLPAISDGQLEHKSKSQRANNFLHFAVDDWSLLAELLGLRSKS